VLVADAGVLQPSAAQAGVPPFDIGDRQLRDRDLGDLVLLDRAHPTLLVARRRLRPRVEVLIDPRIEDVDHLATSSRGAPRADLQRGGETLRVTPTAADRSRDLRRSSAGVGAGENPHLPHPRRLLAQRCHTGSSTPGMSHSPGKP